MKKLWNTTMACMLCICMVGCSKNQPTVSTTESTPIPSDVFDGIKTMERSRVTPTNIFDVNVDITPNVKPYEITRETLDDVYQIDVLDEDSRSYALYTNNDSRMKEINEALRQSLVDNQFAVLDGDYNEFFEVYERNTYSMVPSFVTVDSLLHTYHLCFDAILKEVECNELSGILKDYTQTMYDCAIKDRNQCVDTEFMDAANFNVDFFAVALSLLDPENTSVSLSKEAQKDFNLVMNGEGFNARNILHGDTMEDYSMYKPRGHYTKSELSKNYFRAMMWYSRMNFIQTNDMLNKAALLVNIDTVEHGFDPYDKIDCITSFFAGVPDDIDVYEYTPMIQYAYNSDSITMEDVVTNKDAYNTYVSGIKTLEGPKVNDQVLMDLKESRTTEELSEQVKGFRVFGGRLNLDNAVYTKLVYKQVVENKDGKKRLLPSALDFASVEGSELAKNILIEEGKCDYPNYEAQHQEAVEFVTEYRNEFGDLSLADGWISCIQPLLEEKGEGWPSYMTNKDWSYKNLIGYLGSYAELKHDTVLYSKQCMAEMGGWFEEVIDFRGYVECEPVVYARMETLCKETMEGLTKLGLNNEFNEELLPILEEMAGKLKDISIKELEEQPLSDEDYTFIEGYGGNLQHVWYLTMYNPEDEYPVYRAFDNPGAIVCDIATDPENNKILNVATGYVDNIYVLVEVDGKLRLTKGGVYSFYEFESDQRLRDDEWFNFLQNDSPRKPEWKEQRNAFIQ